VGAKPKTWGQKKINRPTAERSKARKLNTDDEEHKNLLDKLAAK